MEIPVARTHTKIPLGSNVRVLSKTYRTGFNQNGIVKMIRNQLIVEGVRTSLIATFAEIFSAGSLVIS
jgi:hypothetical protein